MEGPERICSVPGIVRPTTEPAAGPRAEGVADQGFQAELDEALGRQDLRFSKHALERLRTRTVSFGAPELVRLRSAVDQAGQKGARESLVLLDDLAFVVSVRNRTVITAMQPKENSVFSSIDSAVIA